MDHQRAVSLIHTHLRHIKSGDFGLIPSTTRTGRSLIRLGRCAGGIVPRPLRPPTGHSQCRAYLIHTASRTALACMDLLRVGTVYDKTGVVRRSLP